MGRQVMEAAGRGGFSEAQALRAASASGTMGSGAVAPIWIEQRG